MTKLKFNFYISFIPLSKVYNVIKFIDFKLKNNNIVYSFTNSKINYSLKGTYTKMISIDEESNCISKIQSVLEEVVTNFNIDITYDTSLKISLLRNN